ncbi:DUF4424 domain-containing protein [Chelativorans oligotrophicus]|nr:DUF4424 domain-containing protein [Chelativorans oligotrophicus]
MKIRSLVFQPILLLCAFMIAFPASANDSTAVLGAGGLEITTSDDIVMEEEKLFLSPEEIRVRYVFRNDTDKDVTTRVAFPLPIVSFGPADNFELPDSQDENFVGFTVTVDGQRLAPALEQRAVLDNGTDVTAAVRAIGLPLNAYLPSWEEKIKAVPREALRRLVEQGVLEQLSDTVETADDVSPSWNLHATFHWEQTFPAQKAVVVEHQYQPVVGSSFFVGDDGELDRLSEEYGTSYCLDDTTKAGVRRLLQSAAKANSNGDYKSYVFAYEVSYILKTGANWKGPIGHFELTIDKIRPDAILSLCIDGVRKTGTTTFKVERDNFTPTRDIGFVVFDQRELVE